MISMSGSTVPAWLPAATTAVGVVLGWALTYVSGQRSRRVERQRDVAGQWRAALVDVWIRARPSKASGEEVKLARDDWYRGWLLYSGAVPAQVSDRIEPLHIVLFLVAGYAVESQKSSSDKLTSREKSGLDLSFAYVVETAFRDALAALDAFITGDRALPARAFPTGGEVMNLMTEHEDDQGLVRVRQALNELPDPPRTRSRITSL